MTKRLPVSNIQNRWFDSEQVDNDDMNIEQNYNNATQFGLINNHIGSGVIPTILSQNVLFDSIVASGLLDGMGIATQNQPSDPDLGNQLAISLTDSLATGRRTIKVAIIGLDFQSNLQYETFVFKTNEIQYTKKHYTNIATLLFNDFIGTNSQSFNLGGRIIISEAMPLTLSRDTIMVAQDVEPNLFFRDFFLNGYATLSAMLQDALPLYNLDTLNINTGFKENQILVANDVTTQIGEKFVATTNNIQKVSLLLSVQNTIISTDLEWSGNLVISIYPLQTAITCPSDIIPNLAIDFSPSNIPLAQISISFDSLQSMGIQLDGTPQPIDFIFSNTSVGNGTTIIPNNYYAVTITRSGDASNCDILLAAGSNHIDNSRVTIFSGNLWVDVPEDNLWFRIYSDAAKITDGQAYETGHGVIIPKTMQDPSTNAQIDYNLNNIQFNGNSINTAILQATLQNSDQVQDQRTGNPVYSRQQFVPTISLFNPIDLANLAAVSEPFTLGVIQDANQKIISNSTSIFNSNIYGWSYIDNTLLLKVITDVNDSRYDQTINSLVVNLLNGDLTNAKITIDGYNPSIFYRIAKSELCTMLYGDVNGDGIIDTNDVVILDTLLGTDLTKSPPLLSSIITDSIHTTVINGYRMYTNPFVDGYDFTWQIVDPGTTNVIASGADGYITANPNNPSLAAFGSVSTDFTLIANLTTFNLVVYNATNEADNGAFTITNIDVSNIHVIDILKLYYNAEIFKQIFRADIDGDYTISATDGYLLQSYIDKTIPFPPISEPSLKIGTEFQVLSLTIEPYLYLDVPTDGYLDRTDDFPFNQSNRATTLHTVQDIFVNDTTLQNYNFDGYNVPFTIIKQLSWEEYIVDAIANARFVPTVFTNETGLTINNCDIGGVICQQYPVGLSFDPGRIDAFVPNNFILGNGGELMRGDGYFYKIDYEVGGITLEIPASMIGVESSINIFDAFVADYTGGGVTRLGFKAMKYADCSFVQPNDIFANRVRFSVGLQSVSADLDGYTIDGYTGVIVDDRFGVWIDDATGLLKLNFSNLYQDPVLLTRGTRVKVDVHLKRGGFNNITLNVDSSTVANLFNLIT